MNLTRWSASGKPYDTCVVNIKFDLVRFVSGYDLSIFLHQPSASLIDSSKYSDITILIADDQPIIRSGLKSIIEGLDFGALILEAKDGNEALSKSRNQSIDLYILEYKMPLLNGYEASRIILRENRASRIAIFSMYNDPLLISTFYQIGVQCFIDKRTTTTEIGITIQNIVAGRPNGDFGGPLPPPRPLQFTTREKELIQLLNEGLTSQAISKCLGLTYKTIETYRCRLLEKVKVKNTSELLGYCHRNGLI